MKNYVILNFLGMHIVLDFSFHDKMVKLTREENESLPRRDNIGLTPIRSKLLILKEVLVAYNKSENQVIRSSGYSKILHILDIVMLGWQNAKKETFDTMI